MYELDQVSPIVKGMRYWHLH